MLFNLRYLGVLSGSLKVKLHSGDNLLNAINNNSYREFDGQVSGQSKPRLLRIKPRSGDDSTTYD